MPQKLYKFSQWEVVDLVKAVVMADLLKTSTSEEIENTMVIGTEYNYEGKYEDISFDGITITVEPKPEVPAFVPKRIVARKLT